METSFVLGEREIEGRRVQLTLEAKVIDGAPVRGDGWEVPPPLNSPRDESASPPAANVVDSLGRAAE